MHCKSKNDLLIMHSTVETAFHANALAFGVDVCVCVNNYEFNLSFLIGRSSF